MEACREVIRTNKLTSAYIRPLVFVGDVGMGVNPPDGYKTDVIIAAFPWGAYLGAEALEQGSMRWFLPEPRGAKHHPNRSESGRQLSLLSAGRQRSASSRLSGRYRAGR